MQQLKLFRMYITENSLSLVIPLRLFWDPGKTDAFQPPFPSTAVSNCSFSANVSQVNEERQTTTLTFIPFMMQAIAD
jgi:hypothetical protein